MLLNARCAIRLLLERLSPRQTWMPSYLCESMLHAADRTSTRVRFYPVDYDLHTASVTWLTDVGEGDVVILIDYFGFPCDAAIARGAKERGAVVVEDACQALLSDGVGELADYALFSPRKFLGVPDGGVLRGRTAFDREASVTEEPPADWWLPALEAMVQRREFDRYGGEPAWFGLFRDVEDRAPIGAFAMSDLSRRLLLHAFYYEAIADRRRRNYEYLSRRLPGIALRPELPHGVVPLGFPVRVARRDELRQRLFDGKIYPPVHWPVPSAVPARFEEARRLAGDIMTLPCDQRYDEADMERIVQAVAGREA